MENSKLQILVYNTSYNNRPPSWVGERGSLFFDRFLGAFMIGQENRKNKILTIKDVAERLGVGVPSVRSYRAVAENNRKNNLYFADDMPEADLYISSIPIWYSATIDSWVSVRPGRGKKRATSE